MALSIFRKSLNKMGTNFHDRFILSPLGALFNDRVVMLRFKNLKKKPRWNQGFDELVRIFLIITLSSDRAEKDLRQ